MEFEVERTSEFLSLHEPCEEAYEKEVIRFDIRTFGNFEEYDAKFKDNWTDRGVNHCVNKDGNIQREIKEKTWFVRIDTLEELLAFKDKYGRLVIEDAWDRENVTKVEIYDGYR